MEAKEFSSKLVPCTGWQRVAWTLASLDPPLLTNARALLWPEFFRFHVLPLPFLPPPSLCHGFLTLHFDFASPGPCPGRRPQALACFKYECWAALFAKSVADSNRVSTYPCSSEFLYIFQFLFLIDDLDVWMLLSQKAILESAEEFYAEIEKNMELPAFQPPARARQTSPTWSCKCTARDGASLRLLTISMAIRKANPSWKTEWWVARMQLTKYRHICSV